MDICKIVFGKSIDDLSYKDIENYFNEEKSESDQVEYKSINEKADSQPSFQKLAETVCGFLNSNGGVLVWGAPRGIKKEKRNEKIFVGPLTPSFSLIEKDKFINKISNLITPIPK